MPTSDELRRLMYAVARGDVSPDEATGIVAKFTVQIVTASKEVDISDLFTETNHRLAGQNERLIRTMRRAESVLRRAEWCNGQCPECGGLRSAPLSGMASGHHMSCELASLIQEPAATP